MNTFKKPFPIFLYLTQMRFHEKNILFKSIFDYYRVLLDFFLLIININIENKFILMQFEGRKLAELAKPTRISWDIGAE